LLNKLIVENYGLIVRELTLIDSHFGTEIFLLKTNENDYIVKSIPSYVEGIENEGSVTEYLLDCGIKAARLLKTTDGNYAVKTDGTQFHVQEFIDGETLALNTAPGWFLEKSAVTLGKIHKSLKGYGALETNFGVDFFTPATANGAMEYHVNLLSRQNDDGTISEIEERICHLKRIAEFEFDTDKMTYAKSHGDYHIGQIITKGRELTVIDWTSACNLPAALEIMVSYTTSDPACRNGEVNADRLKRYINDYAKYAEVNEYDLEIMPYTLYFQQILCHYTPPYSEIANGYKPMCSLINAFTAWLYKNAELLSRELCR